MSALADTHITLSLAIGAGHLFRIYELSRLKKESGGNLVLLCYGAGLNISADSGGRVKVMEYGRCWKGAFSAYTPPAFPTLLPQ